MAVGELDQAEFLILERGLRSVSPAAHFSEAQDLIDATVEEPLRFPTRDLLEVLHSLRLLGIAHGLPAGDVVDGAIASVGLDTSEATDQLASRITALLSTPIVTMSAKAASLAEEHERRLSGCRILTDFRPSFPESGDGRIEAGVVVHDLRLDLWRSGTVETIFIGLDDSDLIELRIAVERAQQKASSIRSWLDELGVVAIPVEDD